MKKLRLFVLATVLSAIAALSAAPAAACRPWMCFEVDENTTCCWEPTCELVC